MSEPLPVLAIAPENDFLNVGPRELLLSYVTPDGAPGGRVIDWEWYDTDGNRLGLAGGALAPLDPAATGADPAAQQLLVSRIDLVLRQVQLRLDQLLIDAGGPDASNRTRIVRAHGDLSDVLVMLAAVDPGPPPQVQNFAGVGERSVVGDFVRTAWSWLTG